jgi:hypothetical protein
MRSQRKWTAIDMPVLVHSRPDMERDFVAT